MKARLIILLVLLKLYTPEFRSQDSIQINILPYWNDKIISLNSEFKSVDRLIISFSELKFYLSNFNTINTDNISNYHLLDISNVASFSFKIPNLNSDELVFNLGVDSLTNMKGVQGGDLDPTNGMYWTWQSGYINFKLEGFYSKQFTGEEEFIFHLGGYSGKKNAIQEVQLEIKPNQPEINIQMNLADLFDQINVIENNMIMSPSVKAVEMSKTIAEVFSVERK